MQMDISPEYLVGGSGVLMTICINSLPFAKGPPTKRFGLFYAYTDSIVGDGSEMDTGLRFKARRGTMHSASQMSDPQGEQERRIGPSRGRNPAIHDTRQIMDL